MNAPVLALLIPIIAILVSGFAIIYAIWAQNRERITAIQKGIDLSSYKLRRKNNPHASAKWGMLLVGIALGIIVGALINHYSSLSEPAVMISSILLFGGCGLLTYYFTIGVKQND
ncbi:MAG: hypothetical protein H6537_07560 [Bacteroidales bacterium]|nr:hypothetical protein [Bacteroidales bacterium]HPD95590.1 hypothetical protein [Tenuifilaceae bacterium]